MGRIDKENYYLDIAQTVAGRSTCLRRCYGAILVKSDENDLHRLQRRPPRAAQLRESELLHPRGAKHPLPGSGTKLCRSVHAEANAIISAARSEALGATLYMACVEPESGALIPGSTSCSMCPPPHHQRRHGPGGHPGHPHGVPGGRCGRLGAGGRLPAPIPLRPRAAEIDSEQECS